MGRERLSVPPKLVTPRSEIQFLPEGLVNAHGFGVGRNTWLWDQRIIESKINLIQGRKTSGKSTACTAIATSIIYGKPLPGHNKPPRPGGRCLWITTEESLSRDVKPRWLDNGGRAEDLYSLNPKSARSALPCLPGEASRLAEWCRTIDARILVVDPFMSMGGPGLDLGNGQSIRLYMESLKHLAENTGVTPLVIQHIRKGSRGSALEAGLGSVEIINVARTILRADKHPAKPGEYLLSVVAANNGAQALPIGFTIATGDGGGPVLNWGKSEDVHLDEILDSIQDVGTVDEMTDARKLLLEILAEKPKPYTEIMKEAVKSGVSDRTLRREKAKLKIDSKRMKPEDGGPMVSYWVLPGKKGGGGALA